MGGLTECTNVSREDWEEGKEEAGKRGGRCKWLWNPRESMLIESA